MCVKTKDSCDALQKENEASLRSKVRNEKAVRNLLYV